MCKSNISHLPEIVKTTIEWGRRQPTSHTVASFEQFTPQATDQLRRYLKTEYDKRNPTVAGSWRCGYELTAGNERVGVTNGHGDGFKIYYRRSQLNGYGKAAATDALPFDGSYPISDDSWIEANKGREVDDYAIEAVI